MSAILGLFVPKDRKRVVFCGRHYGGNTAPLYERCHEFGLVGTWLTRDPSALRAGVLHTRSLAGVWAAARAGNIVLTHALGDLGPLVFPRRATRIYNVWHGMPIKRISRADPGFWARSYARANVREQRRYAGMFVTSTVMAKIFADTFGLPLERIHVTGQPRNDVLLAPAPDFTAALPERAPPHRRRILYCPTWREHEETRLLPFADRDLDGLQVALVELDAVMFVRTHPNDYVRDAPLFAGGERRILPLQGDVVPEINSVLAGFDVLITDYSSVYYDFLMLNRPTIFLPYDLDRYREAPGMYLPFADIAAGPTASTQTELIAALREAFDQPQAWADERKRVRELVYDHVDDRSTTRVLEVIAAETG